MREVYVGGLGNVLRELTRCRRPPARFVYVSSTGVYGQADGEGWTKRRRRSRRRSPAGSCWRPKQLLRQRLPRRRRPALRRHLRPGPADPRQADPGRRAAGRRPGQVAEPDPRRGRGGGGPRRRERGRPGAVYNVCDDRPVRRRGVLHPAGRSAACPAAALRAGRREPPPPHDRANRRISNRRLRTELGVDAALSEL